MPDFVALKTRHIPINYPINNYTERDKKYVEVH